MTALLWLCLAANAAGPVKPPVPPELPAAVARPEAPLPALNAAQRPSAPPAPEAPAPAPSAAAQAAAPPPALPAVFDGARAPRPREELAVLAQPFRTEAQLAKLAAAPRPQGDGFRFVVLGDAEPGRFWISRRLFNRPRVFWRQLKESASREADFTVQLGDMVSRGTVKNFLRFFRKLAALAPVRPYLTVIGNHDRHRPHGKSNSRVYRALFGRTDYYFDHAGVRFVTLDSSAGRVTPEQLAWLDMALDTPLRKAVFTHRPPAALSDWPGMEAVMAVGGFRRGGEELVELLTRRRVERVYMGHVHALSTHERGGVRYILTGGGGSPLYPIPAPNRYHHYLVVSVGPEGFRETVHRPDGTSEELP